MKLKFLKLKKISWKLTILYAFIFSLVLILLNAGILYGVRYFLIQQSVKQVQDINDATSKKIIGTSGEQASLSDPELLNEAPSNSDINLKVADPKGNIIYSSNSFNTEGLNITTQLDAVRKVETGEKHYIVKNSILQSEGKVIAYLQVVKNIDKDYAFLHLLFIMMAIADFLGIVLSIIAGYIVSRRILRPIDKITTTAKSISISDLNSRIETGEADDELTRLAVTFNEMIERLKTSFEKQNQFVSDASHELRTPISVIQGYINLIDRWGKEDRGVLDESVTAIKNETANMAELVEKLLFIARSDAGRLNLQKESIELKQLVEEVIKESKLIAPAHNLTFNVDEKIRLSADRKLIKQMLRAVIDNSIKFTPENGEISISAEAMQKQVKIIIKDTGIGIPPDEVENIFNRFYRVDKARAKDSGGSGLGLSIVKRIVEAHGGNIYAESTVGKGTSIIIILPLKSIPD